jgi:hypothetical protein
MRADRANQTGQPLFFDIALNLNFETVKRITDGTPLLPTTCPFVVIQREKTKGDFGLTSRIH